MGLDDEMPFIRDKMLFPQFCLALGAVVYVFIQYAVVGESKEIAALRATIVVSEAILDMLLSLVVLGDVFPSLQ